MPHVAGSGRWEGTETIDVILWRNFLEMDHFRNTLEMMNSEKKNINVVKCVHYFSTIINKKRTGYIAE